MAEVVGMADGEIDGDRVGWGVVVGAAELEGVDDGARDIVGDVEGPSDG
jgi:hypothetical protein